MNMTTEMPSQTVLLTPTETFRQHHCASRKDTVYGFIRSNNHLDTGHLTWNYSHKKKTMVQALVQIGLFSDHTF